MLTPLVFSALATAAWVGAPVTVQSSASICRLVGGRSFPSYSVYYSLATPGGAMYYSAPGSSCPFAAVLSAIDAAWVAGVLTGRQVEQAQRVVAQAEALFSGAPTPPPAAPAPVCAACGEAADYFGECACAYVPMQVA